MPVQHPGCSEQPGCDIPWLMVAVAREHLAFRRRVRFEQTLRTRPTSIWRCRLDDREFILGEAGVGGAMVGHTLDWLHERVAPRNATMVGFAGALVDELRVGDAVVATDVVDPAGQIHAANLEISFPGRRGRLLTSDHLIASPDEKASLSLQHNAVAVEMESAAFAKWCGARAIPWACVRVISDERTTPLSKEVFELLEDGRVSAWRVACAVARRPALFRELLQLSRATKIAARTIADVLVAAVHS